jgi:hypothetical protein
LPFGANGPVIGAIRPTLKVSCACAGAAAISSVAAIAAIDRIVRAVPPLSGGYGLPPHRQTGVRDPAKWFVVKPPDLNRVRGRMQRRRSLSERRHACAIHTLSYNDRTLARAR